MLDKTKTFQRLSMFDGEKVVSVHRHCGAHGFCSAVLVADSIDSPHRVYTYDGYVHEPRDPNEEFEARLKRRIAAMDAWIEKELKAMATGVYYTSPIVPVVESDLDEGLKELFAD